jgi:hypothetical protein
MFHELNHAKFGWFHVKAILISGVGFFTDAYGAPPQPQPPPRTCRGAWCRPPPQPRRLARRRLWRRVWRAEGHPAVAKGWQRASCCSAPCVLRTVQLARLRTPRTVTLPPPSQHTHTHTHTHTRARARALFGPQTSTLWA